MAKSSSSASTPKGGRGPAKEIKQGDGGVGKTSAGKARPGTKGSTKAAAKVPGAVVG